MKNINYTKGIKKTLAIAFAITLAHSTPTSATIHLPAQNYVNTVRGMDFYSNKAPDVFSDTLAKEYKSYALYKAQFSHNPATANHFAMKALSAFHGERVQPENIYQMQIPAQHIVWLSNGHDDLLHLLETNLPIRYPQLMAEAQAKFDCWADAASTGESNKQIKTCRKRFLKARNHLLAKLEEGCNQTCTVKRNSNGRLEVKDRKTGTSLLNVKTEKKYTGGEISIPKWPNLPIIKNNPPIPVLQQTVVRETTAVSSDNTEIKIAIKKIEDSIAKLNQKLMLLSTPQGQESVSIIPNPDSATKNDIEALKEQIRILSNKINAMPNKSCVEYELLSTQLASLTEKLNQILANPPQPQPIISQPEFIDEEEKEEEDDDDDDEDEEEVIEEFFPHATEKEIIETEIIDRPSDLLPFELFFDWNKANVDYKFLPQLKDIAEKALMSKESIVVQGHTDASGTHEYNKKLSHDRAENVAKILYGYGIPKQKIIIQGVGETEPKIPTAQGVKKPENRRVVIK